MKNRFFLFIVFSFLIFCFIVFYKGLNNSNIYTPKINIKKSIPSFTAKKFNSNTYINSEKIFQNSNFYIINVWASWCVPCKKEHPLLMQLSKNQSPTYEMISGAAIAFAAILLIFPGFATDILGFLIIFPITRKFIFNKFSKKLKPKRTEKNNFIDGDFEDIEDDNDKKI